MCMVFYVVDNEEVICEYNKRDNHNSLETASEVPLFYGQYPCLDC